MYNAPEKSGDFTLTRRGLYAKESNAPQTLCAAVRTAGWLEATRAKAATRVGRAGEKGARVSADAQLRPLRRLDYEYESDHVTGSTVLETDESGMGARQAWVIS